MKTGRTEHIGEIVLSIPSDDRYIHLVDLVLSYVAKQMRFDEEAEKQLELAVIEAGTNAIKHGNTNDPKKMVRFRFRIAEDSLMVFVKDCGSGFDLQNIGDPLSPENIMRPCGRGIFLMKALMDEVEYDMDEDRGTEVRLVKYKGLPKRQATGGHSSYVLKPTSRTRDEVGEVAVQFPQYG